MRPKKPNELHILEGTARSDRGTDVVMQIPDELSNEPKLKELTTVDRDDTFNMFKDWVIAATGAAQIDEIMLSMMVDQLEIYAQAKIDGDVRIMGLTIDRFHKLAREFGMTPATRSTLVSKATETDPMKDIMDGP